MASNTMTLTQLLLLDDKLTPETRKTLAAMGGLGRFSAEGWRASSRCVLGLK
jgi:hypothetical protein